MYSIDSVWSAPANDESNIAWTRCAWEETRKHSQEGRVYLNFAGHGEDGEKLVQEAYGRNYARLAEIKAMYDPGNLFRFNQNIRPAA
jgi:FAD/FMN-containing dehydrogenase